MQLDPAMPGKSLALARFLGRSVTTAVALGVGLASTLACLAAGVQGVLLGTGSALALALAALGSALAVALPAGALGGAAHALGELSRDGGWGALRAMGASGRSVLRALSPGIGLLVLAQALAMHAIAPHARAWAQGQALAETRALVIPAGRTLTLGGWALARAEGLGELHVAGPWGRGTARRAHVSEGRVVLEEVDLRGDPASGAPLARARARKLRIGAPPRSSLPLEARRTSTLLASPEPYARWNGWKRSLLPLGSGMLALGLVAGALRWPRVPAPVWAGGALLASWLTVRALDGAVRGGALPLPGAVAAYGLGMVALAGLPWAHWRDA